MLTVNNRRWFLPPVLCICHRLVPIEPSAPRLYYAFILEQTPLLNNAKMSGFERGGHNIRNRKHRANTNPPPVPPKDDSKGTLPSRGLAGSSSQKPLPSVPQSAPSGVPKKRSLSKPLPAPPRISILRSTFLWVAGFCVWFLLLVLLLPVVMEKDAMPGVNRWLRKLW
jgi:hypothetical protein